MEADKFIREYIKEKIKQEMIERAEKPFAERFIEELKWQA